MLLKVCRGLKILSKTDGNQPKNRKIDGLIPKIFLSFEVGDLQVVKCCLCVMQMAFNTCCEE